MADTASTLDPKGDTARTAAQGLGQAEIVFIIGGPGVGKGTQCTRLAQDLPVVHVSVGDLLRAEAGKPKSMEERGPSITDTMSKGGLVAPEYVQKVLCEHVAEHVRKSRTKFLVDGFPRSVEQAKLFATQGIRVTAILHFQCSKEIMLARVLKRGKSSGRVDDNEKTFLKRYGDHMKSSADIARFYESTVIQVKEVDCEGELPDIYGMLKEDVEALFGLASQSDM